MSPRRLPDPRPLQATGLVILLLLAGCLSQPAGPPPTDTATPLTALQAREVALNWSATGWHQDARVVLVSAIESHDPAEVNSPDPLPVDRTPGDGLSTRWLFNLYSPGADATRTVAVREGGAHVYDHSGGTPSNPPSPLSNWTVDSDAAANLARGNASFRQVLDQPDAEVVMTLGMEEGRPVWNLLSRSHAAGTSASVRVPASG